MKFYHYLLLPASWAYRGITSLRNRLYDAQMLKTSAFQVPVLVVGNLSVGGTGKTPHTEYVVRLLKNHCRVTVLSRGYKRKTSGFILADSTATAATIGDEPMLYYTQFPDIAVAVGEDRPGAIQELKRLRPETEVFVLDDAFQHRPLQASFYLMLTEFDRPFYFDQVMPAGRLRESRSGARRASAILLTKSPRQITELQKQAIFAQVARYAGPNTPVFFSTYTYGQPVWLLQEQKLLAKKLIVLTAIANPKPLLEHLQQQGYIIAEQATFPDHYAYRKADIEKLARQVAAYGPGEVTVVTTSKDAIKLQSPELNSLIALLPICFLPITVEILEGRQAEFDALIKEAAGLEKQTS